MRGPLLIIVTGLLLLSACNPASSPNDSPAVKGFMIVTPKGGETYRIGDTVTIDIYADASYSTVLELSIDNGLSWTGLFDDLYEVMRGSNTVKIAVPATVYTWQAYDQIECSSVTNDAKLRVYQYENRQQSYAMESTFAIIDRN